MSAPLVIRPAAPSDVDILTDLALRSKASHGYDAAFMAQCRAELTIAERTLRERDVWLAEQNGRIVGFFALEPPDAGATEVNPIFVEPDLQHGGVGRALWRKLEERARFSGACAIGLDSDPNAHGFYEKMGCRMIGLSPSGSIPGRLLPRMEKRLDTPPEPDLREIHWVHVRERIITTAKRMLAGDCSYIEGSRIINEQLFSTDFDRLTHPFVVIVAIEASTDHLSVESVREWSELEAWAKQTGETACHEVIAIVEAELIAKNLE